MVTGNESIVLCSYTWLNTCPSPAETARVRRIGHVLTAQHVPMYSDVLDPRFKTYDDNSAVLQNMLHNLPERGVWLAIISNTKRTPQLEAQASLALSRGLSLVVGCHDAFAESISELDRLASANGRVFYWETDQDLKDGVGDVVLPMCDNSTNDCDIIWTSRRKTA